MARTRSRPRSPSPIARRIRRVVMLFLLALVVEYLVLPQLAGARKEVHLLSRVNALYLFLGVLLWSGLVISIPLRGFNPLYGTGALVGALLLAAFAGLVVLLTKGEARAARILRSVARKAPFVDENAVHQLVHDLSDRLREL